MKRLVITTVVASTMVFAPIAHAATWTTVATRTATGESVKVIDVTLSEPTALRFRSRSETEEAVAWVVSCSAGTDVRRSAVRGSRPSASASSACHSL